MKIFFQRTLVLLAIFVLSFGAVMTFRYWQQKGTLFPKEEPNPGQFVGEDYTLAHEAPLKPEEVPGLDRQNDEMIRLVEKVTPSVVSINTEILRKQRVLDPFRGRVYERSSLTPGLGSGVIVSAEGHVITNHHVIEGHQKILVTLHDGRSLPAVLLSSDRLLDIAVLRIQGNGPFQPLKFGNSDEVRVGQIAVAVGNPFGLGETVTVGRISARDRSLSDGQRDMLQTDAAINPGNSGGPLINYLGEIIGINASIYSADRENPGFQGIGFSIPANDARRTFEHILAKGRPVYGYLGLLQVDDLNNRYRSIFKYSGQGVIVLDVATDSPAEKAGLQPYDIVTSFDGEGVTRGRELVSRVQRATIGSETGISVWRGGKMVNLTATIGEYDPLGEPTEPPVGSRLASDETILKMVGIQVQDLPESYRARGFRGILVTRVLPNSYGSKVGLRPRDLLVTINDTPVRTAHDFYATLVATAGVQETKLRLFRGDTSLELTLPKVPRTIDTD